MSESAINALRELTNAPGAPGFEGEIRAIFTRELKDLGNLSTDAQGSVLCERGDGPRVMLTAHMDEVAFRVQSVTPEGFIKFVSLGGWWSHTLLSQRVSVMTSDGGSIPGVVGSKPPHFLSDAERSRVLLMEEMFIDVGAASDKDLKDNFGIRIGDPIVPVSEFTPLHNQRLLMAKAFDNRVGMACLIEATRQLAAKDHPNTLIACATVQEELGMRGAATAAMKAKPDVAIVLEGTPADDTPGASAGVAQGVLGKGVQIRLQDPSAIMNPALVDLVVQVAEQNSIPHQLAVRTSGGTDARAFHLSGTGVPSVVLGVPARYIHSHNSIIDVEDYHAMLQLSVALVQALRQDKVNALTRYL